MKTIETIKNFLRWFRDSRAMDFVFLAIFIGVYLQFRVWVVDMEQECQNVYLGIKGKLNFTNMTSEEIIESLNLNGTVKGECCPCP